MRWLQAQTGRPTKERGKRNKKKRGVKQHNRYPYVEHDEHGEREYFENAVGEDYPTPRQQNHFTEHYSGPNTRFQRSSLYNFPSRSSSIQGNKKVSFISHGGDSEIYIYPLIDQQQHKREKEIDLIYLKRESLFSPF